MATQFNSFSGVDIHAVFGDTVFGELQMVSYKIDREKAPVYTMGSPDLRSIARGKRLITGACVFVVFDRDSLLAAMRKDENIHGRAWLPASDVANFNADGSLTLEGQAAASQGTTASIINGAQGVDYRDLKVYSEIRLADQILPFDITLLGTNEYGKATKMVIRSVELMSEAGGISIDDLVIEKQMSYIARSVQTWTNLPPIPPELDIN